MYWFLRTDTHLFELETAVLIFPLNFPNFINHVLIIFDTAQNSIPMSNRAHVKYIGILLPKFIWPTVRKNCSSDREKLLKLEAEGCEFTKILRSVEQFIQTVKGQNNFWQQKLF